MKDKSSGEEITHQRLPKKKVLYILGAGRSGSTVLDIVFNASDGVVSTGEIINLPRNGWLRNEYCACGSRVGDCEFWTSVRQKWEERVSLKNDLATEGEEKFALAKEFVALQEKYERIRYLLFPGLVRRQPGFSRYLQLMNQIYGAVFATSEATCVVDSSKKHVRGFFLKYCDSFELYVIHLVRDSRGVCWSKAKSFQKDIEAGLERDMHGAAYCKSAKDWVINNALSSLVVKRLGAQAIRIRYEDFVQDPQAVLRRVEQLVDISLKDSISLLAEGRKVVPGHTVAGNRVRMQSELKIKPDLEWQEKLPALKKRIIWLLTSPLMKAYGYKIRG